MLYIVPTPIGNLRDITLRALDALKDADFIACEDTRQTKKLLQAYDIDKPMISYHEHSAPSVTEDIVASLRGGKKVALVSDGGTPLISDPGFELVHRVIEDKISFECLPGACAVVTALAASGLAVDHFSFFGFLSPKGSQKRKTLEGYANREETLIFYESPFRLVKTLEDMKNVFGNREGAVARELTKKFEEIFRGTLEELIAHFSNKKVKGEIVILVSGACRKRMFGDQS